MEAVGGAEPQARVGGRTTCSLRTDQAPRRCPGQTQLVAMMCGLPPRAMRSCGSPRMRSFLSSSGGPCRGGTRESPQCKLGPELLATAPCRDLVVLKAPVGQGLWVPSQSPATLR